MIQKVGIVGSGKMGTDIFNYLSDFNYDLVWFILLDDERESLQKSFIKKLNRKRKHGLIDDKEFNHKSNFKLTSDFFSFASCDLIIESIVEDEKIKKQVISEIEKHVSSECILVSNSSSILPSKLKKTIPVFGMHFFYPISFKNTVELIIPDNSDETRIHILKDFLIQINKQIFIQDEKNAFLLNRFLLQLQIKAFAIQQEQSLSYQQFDLISKEIIPDYGLFEMMDHVGHKTMYNSILNYSKMEEDQSKYYDLLEELKIKIATNKSFVSNLPSVDLNDDEKQAIIGMVKNEVELALLNYSDRYGIDKVFLLNSIQDFCGLSI